MNTIDECCYRIEPAASQLRALRAEIARLKKALAERAFAAAEKVKREQQEARPASNRGAGWVACHESGKILHFSEHDGWTVEQVVGQGERAREEC